MKVLVHFKIIEIEIDDQTYDEYLDGDEIAVREVALETAEALGNRIPRISHITQKD